MEPSILIQSAFWLFVIGAVSSLLVGRICKQYASLVSGLTAVVASLCGASGAVWALLMRTSFNLSLSWLHIPQAGLQLIVDPLAAFFILLICLAAIPISIYSIGYVNAEYLERPIGLLGALYHAFLLSMLLVVTSGNALLFLIAWECMALLSFCLVIFDIKSMVSQRAGYLYLVMTHLGSAFILLMFLLLAQQSGSLDFASFHGLGSKLPDILKSILFVMALVGFGSKAGIVPLHIWLPEAHPAAPSHISALMSGVMIKTAVYGLLRVVFEFLSPCPEWWGVALVMVALLTALLGIVYASVETDFKRLLAYSSIENMGIILLALGTGMIFTSLEHPLLASLAMTAGLFHLLNHSLFKSLLFMVAGAIRSVTHTGSLENLGGLIHKMPQTIFLFLIGALAISAFPPLNGFAGEWLIFQSLLSAIQLNTGFYHVFFILCATLLGLIGALAAATFVKAFSTASLALPRSRHAMHVQEVSQSMRLGMLLPAGLCLLFGIFPGAVLSLVHPVLVSLTHQPTVNNVTSFGTLSTALQPGSMVTTSTPIVFLLLLCLLPAGYFLIKNLGTKMPIRRAETWSCGVLPEPEFEYTSTGFSQPLELAFSKLHGTLDSYYNYFYLPCAKGFISFAHRLKVIQLGSLQVYLAYFLITLILCLLWVQLS